MIVTHTLVLLPYLTLTEQITLLCDPFSQLKNEDTEPDIYFLISASPLKHYYHFFFPAFSLLYLLFHWCWEVPKWFLFLFWVNISLTFGYFAFSFLSFWRKKKEIFYKYLNHNIFKELFPFSCLLFKVFTVHSVSSSGLFLASHLCFAGWSISISFFMFPAYLNNILLPKTLFFLSPCIHMHILK